VVDRTGDPVDPEAAGLVPCPVVADEVPEGVPAQQPVRLEHPVDALVGEGKRAAGAHGLVEGRQSHVRRQGDERGPVRPRRTDLQQRLVGVVPLEAHSAGSHVEGDRLLVVEPEVRQVVGRRVDPVRGVSPGADGDDLDPLAPSTCLSRSNATRADSNAGGYPGTSLTMVSSRTGTGASSSSATTLPSRSTRSTLDPATARWWQDRHSACSRRLSVEGRWLTSAGGADLRDR
jgi:hypothetical protein